MRKATRSSGGILLCLLLGVFYSEPALALYVTQDTRVSKVFDEIVYLSFGVHSLKTASTMYYDSESGLYYEPCSMTDPVLRLFGAAGSTPHELGHDDDTGVGLNAELSVFVPVAGNYRLIVHAKSYETNGCADVYVDDQRIATGAVIGGNTISVTSDASRYELVVTQRYAGLETIPDTQMYALSNCAGGVGDLVALDDDSGVGLNPRITSDGNICKLIISSPDSYHGRVNIYANTPWIDDAWADSDADGLSDNIEQELGTCAFSCEGITNPQDTDRDGLSDMAEVFGVDDPQHPQYLASWGANPLHKDIFIEVDHREALTRDTVDRIFAQSVEDYFASGSATDLRNPDGQDGVSLHFDSRGCSVYSPYGPSFGLCENMGYSGDVPDGLDYALAANYYMVPARRGLFRYALADVGGGGQASGYVFGVGTEWGSVAFTHELGHTIGLSHSGHHSWGDVNCKFNYLSIMNYASSGSEFSQGESALVLNPSRASEKNWPLSAALSLSGDPYRHNVQALPGLSIADVDWNRDGLYSPQGVFTRGPANWGHGTSCGTFVAKRQDLVQNLTTQSDTEYSSLGFSHAAPDLTHLLSRLYVFYVRGDGEVVYRHSAHSGLDSNGGCPGGDQLNGAPCTAWGSQQSIPGVSDAESVSVVTWSNRVFVAYSSGGYIYALYSTSVESNGNLSGWTSPVNVGAGNNPELSIMFVDAAQFGTTKGIGIFYNNLGYYAWRFTASPGSAWSTVNYARTPSGAYLVGLQSPSVVPWPSHDSTSAARTNCGVFPNASSELTFYCYDKSQNRWTDLTAYMESPRPIVSSKVGLAYHISRNSAGGWISSNKLGQFYIAYTVATAGAYGHHPNYWLSEPLSEALPPNPNVRFLSRHRGQMSDTWLSLYENAGVVLYEDPYISALKSAWLYRKHEIPESATLAFAPLADGSFDVEMRDGNDFQVMERGICMALRGAVDTTPEDFCGDSTSSFY